MVLTSSAREAGAAAAAAMQKAHMHRRIPPAISCESDALESAGNRSILGLLGPR